MCSMPVARLRPLNFQRLAQVVILGVAAAVQLSSCTDTSISTSTTSTSTTSTSTSTTSTSTSTSTTSTSTTSTSTTSTTNGSSSAAWTVTETGPPTPARSPLDPAATTLATKPDWCPNYHGAYWTPMTPNQSGNLQPFVVGDIVMSFAILCGVNIPAIPAINPYVFDFSAFPRSSFDDCLQSCAQYNQREAYAGRIQSFAELCSAVTWDKEGRCWSKMGVTAFPAPATGPDGAISAILQLPAITAVGANVNSPEFLSENSGVNATSSDNSFWVSLKWPLCLNPTRFC